jgi:hypothetical protein
MGLGATDWVGLAWPYSQLLAATADTRESNKQTALPFDG